jgi:hypothetical protein
LSAPKRFRARTSPEKLQPLRRWSNLRGLPHPGSRNLTDFSINEVTVDLNEPGPLIAGMNVDVYFGSK